MKNKEALDRMYIDSDKANEYLSKGITIRHDLEDGHFRITKRPKGIYELELYRNGQSEPEVSYGSLEEHSKTINEDIEGDFYFINYNHRRACEFLEQNGLVLEKQDHISKKYVYKDILTFYIGREGWEAYAGDGQDHYGKVHDHTQMGLLIAKCKEREQK
ncbi:hypothetical protein [Priestia megaterium]|uniref:hypothetical protein n=1 Tax=Priestia megaterium TaxID=1404 RepID=UPI000BFCA2FB|nr:hypothetical protein [Priestia megaterium]PGO60639.1 hypothetical protein CN981_08805 [Priestia megaterium]